LAWGAQHCPSFSILYYINPASGRIEKWGRLKAEVEQESLFWNGRPDHSLFRKAGIIRSANWKFGAIIIKLYKSSISTKLHVTLPP
jgi:hypothetical protein